jgi:hypothetical protein
MITHRSSKAVLALWVGWFERCSLRCLRSRPRLTRGERGETSGLDCRNHVAAASHGNRVASRPGGASDWGQRVEVATATDEGEQDPHSTQSIATVEG